MMFHSFSVLFLTWIIRFVSRVAHTVANHSDKHITTCSVFLLPLKTCGDVPPSRYTTMRGTLVAFVLFRSPLEVHGQLSSSRPSDSQGGREKTNCFAIHPAH